MRTIALVSLLCFLSSPLLAADPKLDLSKDALSKLFSRKGKGKKLSLPLASCLRDAMEGQKEAGEIRCTADTKAKLTQQKKRFTLWITLRQKSRRKALPPAFAKINWERRNSVASHRTRNLPYLVENLTLKELVQLIHDKRVLALSARRVARLKR